MERSNRLAYRSVWLPKDENIPLGIGHSDSLLPNIKWLLYSIYTFRQAVHSALSFQSLVCFFLQAEKSYIPATKDHQIQISSQITPFLQIVIDAKTLQLIY